MHTAPSSDQPMSLTAAQAALSVVGTGDPEVADLIRGELDNQRSQLKLIASENYASPAVLFAMGNWFSDKYAEGTPGHRFYAGCEVVDQVESLAMRRATELFGADHAYVQPHSGIDANLVAFWAILAKRVEAPALADVGVKHVSALSDDDWETLRHRLNDQRMIGMSLDAGGHLTHGFRPNISGKLFHQRAYGVDPDSGRIDYDQVAALAREFRPLVITAGYSAYPRLIDFARMREIADDVDATLLVDMAHFAGLVAGKVLTGEHDPVPYADVVTTTTHKSLRGPRGGLVLCRSDYAEFVDKGCPMVLGGPMAHVIAAKAVALGEALRDDFRDYAQRIVDNARALADALQSRDVAVVTGGTDNHLVLIDTASTAGLTGRQAEQALLDAGVVTNRNSIPADPNGAWYTSGVRIGTPAVTTLGMGADEMDEIADIIATTLRSTSPDATSKAKYELSAEVAESCRARAGNLLERHPLYPEIQL